MSYLRFVITLLSIPIGIIALFTVNLSFMLLRLKDLGTKIKYISLIRCLYFRFVCKIVGIEIKHLLNQPLHENPNLVALNHHSFLDIFVIGSRFKGWILAKQEVRNWPLIGTLAHLGGVVFVQRESMESRVRTIFKLKHLSKYSGVCLFPEGTTTANESPKFEDWHHGGFGILTGRPNTVVQAHAISYSEHEFHAWDGDKDFVGHLLKICKKSKNTVYLRSWDKFLTSLPPGKTRHLSKTVHLEICKQTQKNHLEIKKNFAKFNERESSLSIKNNNHTRSEKCLPI